MELPTRPKAAIRKSSASRLSRLAGCSVLALCIPAATHGESASGPMSVSAIVVEACRASLTARARSVPESSRTDIPPRPQVELRCSHGQTPYVIDEQAQPRSESVRVRSCPDCGDGTYTTIVF